MLPARPVGSPGPLVGQRMHQSAPSDSCSLHHALYNEPTYFGVDLDGSRLMPDFSLLQPGACVRFQYRSKQGTSSTAFRIAIVGHQGKNSDTTLGKPGDNRVGWWMRHFDMERYGRGNSKVKFY